MGLICWWRPLGISQGWCLWMLENECWMVVGSLKYWGSHLSGAYRSANFSPSVANSPAHAISNHAHSIRNFLNFLNNNVTQNLSSHIQPRKHTVDRRDTPFVLVLHLHWTLVVGPLFVDLLQLVSVLARYCSLLFLSTFLLHPHFPFKTSSKCSIITPVFPFLSSY